MAVLEILTFPNPALKRAADPVIPGPVAEALARDLAETMRSFKGCVGIAAPQVDRPVRMIVVDVTGHPKATVSHGLLVLANPRIVDVEGSEVGREGCLSVPDLTANVRRAVRVVVEAQDPRGARRIIATEGFEARCLQHEIDHLDGLLFLDRVESLKTDVFRRKRY